MKNKRGDVTITVLVIGVFVVCTLAMAIFFLSSLQKANNFVDIGLIEKVSVRMEQGDPEDSSDALGDFLKEDKFAREHWYSLSKTKEMFSVKYYFPK